MAESTDNTLKIGFPSGSLQEATFRLFDRAGYNIRLPSRSYEPDINDPELSGLMFRAQEIAHYVERGVLDVGMTGKDWVEEWQADVVEIGELRYSKATSRPLRWVIAVPEDSPIRSVQDLQGKTIASELVGVTRRFLEERGVQAQVDFSWGTTEVKAGIPGVADAIVDGTETGSSLRANRLRIVEVMLESTTRFIANEAAWDDPWKRRKAQNLYTLLLGALEADAKVGLKMNVPKDKLPAIMELLPALHAPTVSNQADDNWVAVEIIADERLVRDMIPELKRSGAEGIIEYPLNKVVY
jgi:ATP phosphoribosyltransferase